VGWFIVVLIFGGYLALLPPSRTRISGSWYRAGSGALWIVCCAAIIALYGGADYWGVNALWDRLSYTPKSPPEKTEQHKPDVAPGPLMPPPSSPSVSSPVPSKTKPEPTFARVLGDFVVIAGGREYKPGAITVFGEKKPAISAYVEDGKLFVDAQLYSTVGRPPLRLVKNKLMATPPQWDTNFDNSAIEVVDEQGKPRFQLIYHDPHTVFLRGIFQFENRVVVIEEKNQRFAVGSTLAEMETKPLFKYPSRLYQGQELGSVTSPQPANSSDSLFINCQHGTMPSMVPASGHIYVLSIAEIANGGGGLTDYFGLPNSPWKWNNSGLPEWAYRCEVTNYLTAAALDIWMDLRLTFREVLPVPNQPNSMGQGRVTLDRDWRITIPNIDPGSNNAFIFYIWNSYVHRFVQVTAPDHATIQGEDGRRTIKVKQPVNNLLLAVSPGNEAK
jgi:hypothetical protein